MLQECVTDLADVVTVILSFHNVCIFNFMH